jgi:hypothetical protein
MKKLIMILMIGFTLIGCKKDELKDLPTNKEPDMVVCECGEVVNSGTDNECPYFISIKNLCTENIETFCFEYEYWIQNYHQGFILCRDDKW